MPTFNFSSYYLNKSLSDVKVVITVPDDEVVLGRRQAEQLPGHGIVLANVSPLFKAQIEHQGAKYAQITLDVGLDQVCTVLALLCSSTELHGADRYLCVAGASCTCSHEVCIHWNTSAVYELSRARTFAGSHAASSPAV